MNPLLTTDCGNPVAVIALPEFIGALANACAPAKVNAKYFPDWLGLDP